MGRYIVVWHVMVGGELVWYLVVWDQLVWYLMERFDVAGVELELTKESFRAEEK